MIPLLFVSAGYVLLDRISFVEPYASFGSPFRHRDMGHLFNTTNAIVIFSRNVRPMARPDLAA
jgi:hypothetical protein